MTSGKKISRGLDNAGNTGYTGNTMNNEKKSDRVQQLKHTDEKLWKRVKVAAVMKDQTMTEWVEEALKTQLAASKPADKKTE